MTAMRQAIDGHQGSAVPNQFLRREGDADHLAIFLPGLGYTCDMPLFFYAQNLFEERGADILRVEYAYGHQSEFQRRSSDEQRQWLLDDAAAAYRVGINQRPYRTVTLIGKSLGTLAMGHLLTTEERSDIDMNAVWLTPLLRDETLRTQMATCEARSLVAIGSADPHFDADFLRTLRETVNAETVIGALGDHGFDIPGDVPGSINAVAQFVAALERLLTAGRSS